MITRAILTAAVLLALPAGAHAASWRLLPPLADDGSAPLAAFGPGGEARVVWNRSFDDAEDSILARRVHRSGRLGRIVATRLGARIEELTADREGNWLMAGARYRPFDRFCCTTALGGFARPNGRFSTRELSPIDDTRQPPDLALGVDGATAAYAVSGRDGFTPGPIVVTKGRRSGATRNPVAVGAEGNEASVAVDRRRRAHVVWTQGEYSDGIYLMYARQLRSGRFSRPIVISRPHPSHIVEVVRSHLGVDATGRLVATYVVCDRTRDGQPAGCRIEATTKPAGGSRFGRARVLDRMAFVNQMTFAMTATGHAVAAWQHHDAYPDSRVMGALLRPGRTRFEATRLLAPSSVDGPVAAIGNRGHAVIAWNDGSAVQAAFRRRGRRFGRPVEIAEANYIWTPGVAVSNDGRALVTFMQATEPGGQPVAIRAALRE